MAGFVNFFVDNCVWGCRKSSSRVAASVAEQYTISVSWNCTIVPGKDSRVKNDDPENIERTQSPFELLY